jgi:hypothetical protein
MLWRLLTGCHGFCLLLLCCACRAVGDAAPAQAVRRLREDNPRFRMLGLSATPGNEHSHIQVGGPVRTCVSREEPCTARLQVSALFGSVWECVWVHLRTRSQQRNTNSVSHLVPQGQICCLSVARCPTFTQVMCRPPPWPHTGGDQEPEHPPR